MKAGVEHRVQLSDQAIAVVSPFVALCDSRDAIVFARGAPNRSMSHAAMLSLMQRMGRNDLTSHGFRSTFRDWAAECSNFPREVVEMALAHTIRNKSEAAYRRGDLFVKRRALMLAWAGYCDKLTADDVVVPIGSGRKAVVLETAG